MIKTVDSKDVWEKFVRSQPEANFLQAWNWGVFHEALGHQVFRLGLSQGKRMVGGALAVKEMARRGTYLTVPGGPLINWQNLTQVAEMVQKLQELGRQERCAFVRIRPQAVDSPELRATLYNYGFVRSPMHLHAELTRMVDVSQTDDELLAAMRKNTRHEVRRAMKMNVKVLQSTDIKLVEVLYELQLETARRHKFVPFSRNYFVKQFEAFVADNQAVLFVVNEPNGIQPISIAMGLFYNREAVYHYSASSDIARSIPAAYAMQWEIIQEAKRRGCVRYNMWGDVADSELMTHRFAGPSLFKRGFGGEQLAYVPAHDLPLSKRYWLTHGFERVRKRVRRL